jgi:hypothetical protein
MIARLSKGFLYCSHEFLALNLARILKLTFIV